MTKKKRPSRRICEKNPLESLSHGKLINIIFGGSDIYRLTYSTAKTLVRVSSSSSKVPKDCGCEGERKLEVMAITFNDDDVCEEEYHDKLVISLSVSTCLLRRVLDDGDRSANILCKSALESTSLYDGEITKKSTVMIGFVGEMQKTIGEIVLPTYAKGVNLQTKFNVLDCPSTYNVILGTPQLMKSGSYPLRTTR